MKFILPALIMASGAFVYGAEAAPQPANTPQEMPDLVITSVGVLESEDEIGTEAHLIARIENRGLGATQRDVAHGVAFFVDGEFVAWSDTYRQDLKPGQFAILRSNSGPNGSATWKITPGKHTFRAVVDDVSRINESDEENNAFQTTLEWKTPVAANFSERKEFADISREVYGQLRDLQKAGLFQAANTFLRNERSGNVNQLAFDFTRYEAAVALARLQDAIPALTSDDQAQRLRAIDAATASAGRKLSSAKIEELDANVLTLRVDLKDELAWLMTRNTGIEVRNLKLETVAPPRVLQSN